MAPKKGGAKGAAASSNAGPSHEYNTNDVVLAKVKGYPEWPGKVRKEPLQTTRRGEKRGSQTGRQTLTHDIFLVVLLPLLLLFVRFCNLTSPIYSPSSSSTKPSHPPKSQQ